MTKKLISLYFRTNKSIEKIIVKDAKNNFRNNYSEAVRNRLAERYNINIEPRMSVGMESKSKKANVRVTRVEQEIYDAVQSDAKMLYEGNTSQTVRIGLTGVYRKLRIIK